MITKKELVYVTEPSGGGSDISDTTAVASDVLAGKDFYLANGTKTSGTIQTYAGSTAVTPTEQAQTLGTDDKYVTENITVGAIPSNYKDTTGTDAVSSDILAGKKAVTGAGLVTGAVQTYSGESTVTQNGTLATAGKYVASNIEVAVPSSSPVLVTKSITENGTYNAASDNADGYSSVEVIVAAVSKLPQVVDRSVTSIDAADLAGITKIGEHAFQGCYKLSSITFPNSITRIQQYAFDGCIKLNTVTINEGVIEIGGYAFKGCNKLTSVSIPSTVTEIDVFCFNGCTSLNTITILATTPPTLMSTSSIPTTIQTIYIPNGTLSAYQGATNWSSFSSKFVELPA